MGKTLKEYENDPRTEHWANGIKDTVDSYYGKTDSSKLTFIVDIFKSSFRASEDAARLNSCIVVSSLILGFVGIFLESFWGMVIASVVCLVPLFIHLAITVQVVSKYDFVKWKSLDPEKKPTSIS